MRVSRLLGDAGIDIESVSVRVGLPDLDGVDVRPAPPWMRRLWKGRVRAMTIRDRIFVEPELLDRRPDTIAPLILHELVHVRQWRSGAVRFLTRYGADYLMGRLRRRSHAEAYAGIRFEVEARHVAGV